MPYKKQIARKSKSVISENLRTYLLTGERKNSDAEVFRLSGSWDLLQKVWNAVRNELTKDWIKENPCTRPFIFWLLASERRKKISGSGGWRPGMAIDSAGLPQYWQLNWNKKNAPIFESQAAYLQRNELLNEIEKAYLAKHLGLLKPEKIEYDED